MRKPITWLVAAVLVGGGVGLYLWQPWANRSDPVGTAAATMRVALGDITLSLAAFGEVVATGETSLVLSGDQIRELRVSEGAVVEGGEVLAVLNSTREELALLRAEWALVQARADGIPSTIRERELEYEIAKATYEATTVRAPHSGLVTEVTRTTTTAGASQYKITILDRSELFIQASIPENQATSVAVGQRGTATVDALPGRSWQLEIVRVGQRAVQEAGFGGGRVISITARLISTSPEILPGFSARIQVTIAQARGVVRVPIQSLVTAGRGWAVYKVVGGEPVLTPVEVGITSDQFAEVVSGLAVGDEILLYPPTTTTPGTQRQGTTIPFVPGEGWRP